jgi:hypothetical protein
LALAGLSTITRCFAMLVLNSVPLILVTASHSNLFRIELQPGR